MRKVNGYGPDQADIVIVGEAPGKDEELRGRPFVGASGFLLREMLRESGIDPRKVYFTNVCKYRPPDNKISHWFTDKRKAAEKGNLTWHRDGYYHNDYINEGLEELPDEIYSREPKIIIGMGNIPLWALTGNHGITAWRGSEMNVLNGIPFVPTIHPAAIQRKWDYRAQVVHDLEQRVVRRMHNGFYKPEYLFDISPTFDQVMFMLTEAINCGTTLAGDIETSRNKITCMGFAWSSTYAMCIPFRDGNGPVWDANQEKQIIDLIGRLNENKQMELIGQNFSGYDSEMIQGLWGKRVLPTFDTMIAQSVAYPNQPRKLGFLSSMYCQWHCYWKEDNKDWNNIKDYDAHFRYNCRDCCATYEVAMAQKKTLERAGLTKQFNERMEYAVHVYDMGQRGVLRDEAETNRLESEIEEALQVRAVSISEKAGHPVNPLSPPQVQKLFYEEIGCRKVFNRKSTVEDAVSTGDDALKTIAVRNPELADLVEMVLEYRSLSSIRSNFIRSKLDPDERLRSTFLPTGTYTFRITSGTNAFGRGTNLLNITDGEHTHSGRTLPNLRKCIIPDQGYTIFEIDLKKADAWIVAYEAEDEALKELLRSGADIHRESARTIFSLQPDDPVNEHQYSFGKIFRHATHYGGSPRALAMECGCSIHEADMGQQRLFQRHPGIQKWHKRIKKELVEQRAVHNAFGYRIVFFDRPEGLLGEGLSWVPQSTIALLTSLIHMKIDNEIPDIQVMLQVYDSVMGQYPTHLEDQVLPLLHAATKIAVPYPDQLYIPMELKTSTKSWGACEKRQWPEDATGLVERIC